MLQGLPGDVLGLVVSCLGEVDVLALGSVCRMMRAAWRATGTVSVTTRHGLSLAHLGSLLSSCHTLRMSYRHLVDVSPATSTLSSLTSLAITNVHNVSGGLWPVFGSLAGLVECDLSQMILNRSTHTSIMGALRECLQLRVLHVGRIELTNPLLADLGDIAPRLSVLTMPLSSAWSTPDAMDRFLSLCRNLRGFHVLSGQEHALVGLTTLEHLTDLTLSTPYSALAPLLGHLPSVTRLTLCDTQVPPRALAASGVAAKEISLPHTTWSLASLGHVVATLGLVSLSLKGLGVREPSEISRVSDEEIFPRPIFPLSSLQSLWIAEVDRAVRPWDISRGWCGLSQLRTLSLGAHLGRVIDVMAVVHALPSLPMLHSLTLPIALDGTGPRVETSGLARGFRRRFPRLVVLETHLDIPDADLQELRTAGLIVRDLTARSGCGSRAGRAFGGRAAAARARPQWGRQQSCLRPGGRPNDRDAYRVTAPRGRPCR
jgi:hypothetical protein